MPHPKIPPTAPEPVTFTPATEILLTRTDRLREDVRRLHPLLDLLEPPEGDETTLFAIRLIDLLDRIETAYADHGRAFRGLEGRLARIDAQLTLLMGGPD